MANTRHSAFSQDGQFLAVCDKDGKLKIWETATSRLKQEFIPNLHLSSPCSVLGWIVVDTHAGNTTSTSPCKKNKKKSRHEDPELKEIVALGCSNGTITLYDVSTSSINDLLENGHSSSITALTWSPNAGLFTAAGDKHIVQWNLEDKSVNSKWEAGSGRITSLAILPEGRSLLSGERMIKWWDIKTKQLIGSFISHPSQINALKCIKVTNETSYLFCSGAGDDYLSVWSLNEVKRDKEPVATFNLPDEIVSFSAKSTKDSQIMVVSITRSGNLQLFDYKPNGTLTKPLKPNLNLLIAADGSQEQIQQISILAAELIEDSKILLAYGSFSSVTIEKVIPDFSDKVQFLVRADAKKSKDKKEEVISKIKLPDVEVEEKVKYLTPGVQEKTAIVGTKRSKAGASSQITFEDRLHNLSLNAETCTPNKSTTTKKTLTELLLQGLHSGDQSILQQVFFEKKDTVIDATVEKLPIQAILPLIAELTALLCQGKTQTSQIAYTWIQKVMMFHASYLFSVPDIKDVLAPIMAYCKAKSAAYPEQSKLAGRMRLLIGKHPQEADKHEKDITKECMLVYQDEDSSEEESDINKPSSESDDKWEETLDQMEEM